MAMQGDEKQSYRKRRGFFCRKWKPLLAAAGIAVVLVVMSAIAMHFTSQPNFCASCHEIQPQVVSWEKGQHKGITCLSCHSNPGTLGYVARKFKGLGEVYLHYTNQIPQKIEAKFNIQACIYCHTGKDRNYPNAKNISLTSGNLAPPISHQEMLSKNVSCLLCHRLVGHPQEDQNNVKEE